MLNQVHYHRQETFDLGYVEHAKILTSTFKSTQSSKNLLEQDTLTDVVGSVYGNTGFDCMFRWASGRVDYWGTPDFPPQLFDGSDRTELFNLCKQFEITFEERERIVKQFEDEEQARLTQLHTMEVDNGYSQVA